MYSRQKGGVVKYTVAKYLGELKIAEQELRKHLPGLTDDLYTLMAREFMQMSERKYSANLRFSRFIVQLFGMFLPWIVALAALFKM